MTATPLRRRHLIGLRGRWPTALAIVAGAALAFDAGAPDDTSTGLAGVLLFLPLVYLLVASLGRPRATWPVVLTGSMALTALQLLDPVAPSTVMAVVALAVLVWNAVSGRLHRSGMLRIQALGMVGFGALALIGLAVDPAVGRYVVAGGWFLHGLWDLVHLRLGAVVARSYAEFCGVFDLLVAAALLTVP